MYVKEEEVSYDDCKKRELEKPLEKLTKAELIEKIKYLNQHMDRQSKLISEFRAGYNSMEKTVSTIREVNKSLEDTVRNLKKSIKFLVKAVK